MFKAVNDGKEEKFFHAVVWPPCYIVSFATIGKTAITLIPS